MKAILMLLVLMIAAQAQATTPVLHIESFLQVTHIDDQSPLAVYDITTAHISYDTSENTLTLTIEPNMPKCLGGTACIAVMPEPVIIKMDNVQTLTDRCGATQYSANFDNTPHDGLRETLRLIDITNDTCLENSALPKYQVEYITFNPWTQSASSAHFSSIEQDYSKLDKVVLPVEPLEIY